MRTRERQAEERRVIRRSRPYGLTEAELRVWEIIARRGLPAPRIARELGKSPDTIRSQVRQVIMKLGVSTREEIIIRWWKEGRGDA